MPLTYDLNVPLSTDDVERCVDFARAMSQRNQGHEFNNSNTATRSVDAIYKDNIIGRLAEMAIFRHLTSFFIHLDEPDFTVYGDNQKDNGDLHCGKRSISVKATERGRYLLVHEGQIRYEVADVYFLCQAPLKGDAPLGFVKILGYNFKTDLLNVDKYKNWSGTMLVPELCGARAEFAPAGNSPRGLSCPLQAPNLYIHPEQRRTDAEFLLDRLYAITLDTLAVA